MVLRRAYTHAASYEQKGAIKKITFSVLASQFFHASCIAAIPAILTICLHKFQGDNPGFLPTWMFPQNPECYTTLNWVLGFVLVFRTGQAYNRFWHAALNVRRMGAEWIDACAQICAFAEDSGCDADKVKNYKAMMIRLFSLLHCVALQQITEVDDDSIEVIDSLGIGVHNLAYMRSKDKERRIHVVFQWIQAGILFGMKSGLIKTPPPIISRCFQELNAGMVALAEMQTIEETPFPVPYARMVTVLLLTHMSLTPFFMINLTDHFLVAGVFAFMAVFLLWILVLIAMDIEEPFGDDLDDLDFPHAQEEINCSLMELVEPELNFDFEEAMDLSCWVDESDDDDVDAISTSVGGYRKGRVSDLGNLLDDEESRNQFVERQRERRQQTAKNVNEEDVSAALAKLGGSQLFDDPPTEQDSQKGITENDRPSQKGINEDDRHSKKEVKLAPQSSSNPLKPTKASNVFGNSAIQSTMKEIKGRKSVEIDLEDVGVGKVSSGNRQQTEAQAAAANRRSVAKKRQSVARKEQSKLEKTGIQTIQRAQTSIAFGTSATEPKGKVSFAEPSSPKEPRRHQTIAAVTSPASVMPSPFDDIGQGLEAASGSAKPALPKARTPPGIRPGVQLVTGSSPADKATERYQPSSTSQAEASIEIIPGTALSTPSTANTAQVGETLDESVKSRPEVGAKPPSGHSLIDISEADEKNRKNQEIGC